MDKKILLSGVAALLMSGAMFAPSASASALDVSWSGEASLSATFNDACKDSDVELSTSSNTTVATVAVLAEESSCAGSVSDDMPVWATSSELSFSAAGTLANGLGVSADLGKGAAGGDGVKVGLSGAFGSINWKNNGDSAVKAALPNGDGDLTVSSRDSIGGHTLKTAGTAGYVVNYAAPSMGGMDLFLSYAPSNENKATNEDNYLDTIALGAKMAAGDITIGAAYETATENGTNAACDATNDDVDAASGGNAGTDDDFTLLGTAAVALGGDYCGDQTLMGLGASMSVGDMAINAGYTTLDTEEADKTSYNIGLSTAVGAYTLGVDYVNSQLTYAIAGTTDQTMIGASLSTNLGDGVDLSLGFTTSSVAVANTAAHSNYNAEVKLVATF